MEEKKLAKRFHDTYERLAPQFGYETREDTKEFDENSPNGKLMIAVCKEVMLKELDRAREEGYQKGWEDGSKGKVFEKIEVETEVTFKDLRDVIEGKEDAGEFLSKLTTK